MEIKVSNENIRLDKYINDNCDLTRSQIAKAFENDLVLVNNEVKKASYKTILDDVINIDVKEVLTKKIEPNNIKLNIIYEDDHILVINKQSGLVVHPGSGNNDNTLVGALLNISSNLSDIGGEHRAGIVHRLDKDTSGLMLVAKTNEAHEILAEGFKNKTIKREYTALVNGIFKGNTAKIKAPIAKSKLDFRKQEINGNGKEAITNVIVLKRYKKYSLLKVFLETGRTHQIRVHLEYIGYPIHNDPVYNVRKATEFGQFLHSTSIDFIHPITKEPMHFECELPAEFQEFIDSIE